MKLVAIFICWDDWEILTHAIESIAPQVEGIIVIGSTESSSGEFSPIPSEFYDNPDFDMFLKQPDPTKSRRENETDKRNFGLDKAREIGYTHFIMLDADEFYPDFTEEKKRFEDPELIGLVCASRLYFKEPTLCFEDSTRVPFIHRLTTDIRFEKNYQYPFSVNEKDNPAIDPTRTMNVNNLKGNLIQWSEVKMHHFSYLRSDIRKKIRNSAGQRVKTFQHLLLDDYRNAKEGYRMGFFNKTLERTENIFNLPRIVDVSFSGPPAS